MAQQWEVESASGRCAATGRVFEQGEEFYTVLYEKGDSFTRADYSVEAWNGPPAEAYCHFKTRVPVKERRKKLLVDNEVLISFFERLADETEPVRVQFRFVLALILMRKRLLRYEKSSKQDDAEVWDMTLARDQSHHRVVNPELTDDQIASVGEQLGAILHSDMGEWGEDQAQEAEDHGSALQQARQDDDVEREP